MPACVCVCGASGLSCVLRQAVVRNGGGFLAVSQTGLFFQASVSIEKQSEPRKKPNLSPHTGSQRLARWILDSILALKVICSVIPEVHLSSCGCSVGPGGSSDCRLFKVQPARRDQSEVDEVKYVKM